MCAPVEGRIRWGEGGNGVTCLPPGRTVLPSGRNFLLFLVLFSALMQVPGEGYGGKRMTLGAPGVFPTVL